MHSPTFATIVCTNPNSQAFILVCFHLLVDKMFPIGLTAQKYLKSMDFEILQISQLMQ